MTQSNPNGGATDPARGGPARGARGLRLAGEVLEGRRPLSELASADQDAVLEIAIRGKLPLFVPAGSPRGAGVRGDASTAAAAGRSVDRFPGLRTARTAPALDAERARCEAQREAFARAQQALARADVPLVFFKTNGPYPYTSSNVDVLVPRGALARAADALARAGHHEMVHYWEPHKRLFRQLDGTRCRVMMHLHEQVGWIVLSFGDVDALWESARSSVDPLVRHAAPEHTAAALLAHSVYESNRVSLGDLFTVREAFARPDFDRDALARIAERRAWQPGLELALGWYAAAERMVFAESVLAPAGAARSTPAAAGGRVARALALVSESATRSERLPLELPRSTLKPFFLRKLFLDNRRTLRERTGDAVGLAHQIFWGRLGLRRRPAAFVCICGIDGSGKTTHADALRDVLAQCELPARRIWMRAGYSPAIEWLKRIARSSSARVPGTDDAEAKLAAYRSPRTRALWTLLVGLEQVVQANVAVRAARLSGRTAVAERYVPDSIADLCERFGDAGFADSQAARWLRWLTPRPDLLIHLDVPAEVAHARKPDDFDVAVLAARTRHYGAVLARYGDVVRHIDASRPEAEVTREVVDAGLRGVFEKIRRRNPLARQRRDIGE